MGIRSLIQLATILAVLAVSSGKLPAILHAVQIAKLHLIKDSQATNWGQAMLIPTSPR